MLVAFVNFELGQQHAPEAVLGNHALDGAVNEHLGLLRAHLRDGGVFLAALPAGIAHVFLGRLLLAGDADLLGVDDDDEVAGIEVRRIDRLVFAAQNVGDLHGQAAQHGAVGINDMPLALVQIHFRQIRFHAIPNKGTQTLANEQMKSIAVSGHFGG